MGQHSKEGWKFGIKTVLFVLLNLVSPYKNVLQNYFQPF